MFNGLRRLWGSYFCCMCGHRATLRLQERSISHSFSPPVVQLRWTLTRTAMTSSDFCNQSVHSDTNATQRTTVEITRDPPLAAQSLPNPTVLGVKATSLKFKASESMASSKSLLRPSHLPLYLSFYPFIHVFACLFTSNRFTYFSLPVLFGPTSCFCFLVKTLCILCF